MTAIVIPPQCAPRHSARCPAALAAETGWDVCVEVDDHIVSSTHCSDWHRVERICERFARE